MNTKQLFILLCLSCAITLFFYLDFYLFRIEQVIVGAIRELFLIPATMSVPFLTLLLGVRWYSKKYEYHNLAIIGTLIGAFATALLVYSIVQGR